MGHLYSESFVTIAGTVFP